MQNIVLVAWQISNYGACMGVLRLMLQGFSIKERQVPKYLHATALAPGILSTHSTHDLLC